MNTPCTCGGKDDGLHSKSCDLRQVNFDRKPHKHADVIKAWADGAEIEFYNGFVWCPVFSPTWKETIQYRVKPAPLKFQKEREAFYLHGKQVECRVASGLINWVPWKVYDPSKRSDSYENPDERFSGKNSLGIEFEFRIKPEVVAFYGRVLANDVGEGQGVDLSFSFPFGKSQTRGGQDNLKLTFVDGELVSAEILKDK